MRRWALGALAALLSIAPLAGCGNNPTVRHPTQNAPEHEGKYETQEPEEGHGP
jgi:hypothetical protein